MKFISTPLQDAYLIEIDAISDERGFFARSWCAREFEKHGLNCRLSQSNLSFNHKSGTLRGMHFQRAPHAEVKLVRCTRGRIFDAIVDIRPSSPTCGKWFGAELSADNHRMMYVPEGFAHGYLTREDNTEVFYQVSEFYSPESEGGIRFDDPQIGIQWPDPILLVSPKDQALGYFNR
ncbi:MAG TPA: dTDP-4-dehydrorhamnose 3,5-epimerase [Candidatus Ozemobacteraceae bacterium]|mgnify:CR=1 FL=1|nr:dTDP-4-dehydrorhamnose 3,5-epimerase [Candidatus Ozemobacteraceae bacterium]